MPPEFTGFNVARFQSLQVRSTGNARNGDIQVAGLRCFDFVEAGTAGISVGTTAVCFW
jgi:hypothetical protein